VIFYALESVKQLHAGNMKNLLDVSETSFCLNVRHSFESIELKM